MHVYNKVPNACQSWRHHDLQLLRWSDQLWRCLNLLDEFSLPRHNWSLGPSGAETGIFRKNQVKPWLLMAWLVLPLRWRQNGRHSVSNHQPHDCLLNRLFRRRSKKTSKLRVTGLCAGNSPRTGEFPAQMTSDAENVSIWLRHRAPSGHQRSWYRL